MMTFHGTKGLEHLDSFHYAQDQKLTEVAEDMLLDNRIEEEYRGAIGRMRVLLDSNAGTVRILYRERDRETWDDDYLRKRVINSLAYILDYSQEEWEDHFKVDFWSADGIYEVDLTAGIHYCDPLDRELPAADEVWEQVCKLLPKDMAVDIIKTRVSWLGYARLFVEGPLRVLNWINYNYADVADTLANSLGSHNSVVTLGFETIEDAVGDPLLEYDFCSFRAYHIPLLYECKIAQMQHEWALYAPYYSIQVVQEYISAIEWILDMPVSVVPVPLVKVPSFLVVPYMRTRANLIIL